MLFVALAFLAGLLVGFLVVAAVIASYRRSLDRAFTEPPHRSSAGTWHAGGEYGSNGMAGADAVGEAAQRELLERYGREFSPEVRRAALSEVGRPRVGSGIVIRVRP